MFAFDHDLHELDFGKKMSADGGTMSFDDLLNHMRQHTADFMINVIITDAGFSVDKRKVKEFIKDIKGMLLFITNEETDEMKELAKIYDTQVYYILADRDITIKKQ